MSQAKTASVRLGEAVLQDEDAAVLDLLAAVMRMLAMPKAAEPWSLTSLREKLIKIGAKVVSHGRYVTFQMAEVAVSRRMFQEILLCHRPAAGAARASMRGDGVRCDRRRRGRCARMNAKQRVSAPRRIQLAASTACCGRGARFTVVPYGKATILVPQPPGIRGMLDYAGEHRLHRRQLIREEQ